MIEIKTEKEIEIMKANGRILSRIMEELKTRVKPGAAAKELELLAEEMILKEGAKPSFKNYHGFPGALCVSLNREIVHGIANEKIFKSGDLVSLDLGLFKNGFHADMAFTLALGKVPQEAGRLLRATKKVLKLAIKKAVVGNTFGDVGHLINRYSSSLGFNVIRELCGHGIGRELHQEPQILNFGKRKSGAAIKEGMVFCLEPMLAIGDWRIKKGSDGFAWETRDGSLSAHFEHTIAIVGGAPLVLTSL